ncbi:MAG: polysaccharide deacetylase family protein [Caulobacteraceae bacterium]|nr:polysaccharide deacetylase family protein [Caulobacteraceae bacterium]
MTVAYAPRRDLVSKVRRRMTQHYAARPAKLAFERPVLSITFDDFPASAADAGAHACSIATAHAAPTTCPPAWPESMARAAWATRRPDIARLVASGHEIGCHTSTHADCAQQDIFATLEDLARNRDALLQMGAPAPRTHAYPYGETKGAMKDNLPPRFMSARGILPGLNVGAADLAQLRAYPLFGAGGMQRVSNALEARRKRNLGRRLSP